VQDPRQQKHGAGIEKCGPLKQADNNQQCEADKKCGLIEVYTIPYRDGLVQDPSVL